MSSTTSNRTALVFGASGITGWAIVKEAVSYPSHDAFSSIIGLTNRTITKSAFLLPDDDRIVLASGVDLTAGVEVVRGKLKQIQGIENVTDVFFAAYVQPPGTSDVEGWEELKRVNVEILETAVLAVESLSSRLRFWSLQTGGKRYGWAHVGFLGVPKTSTYSKESDPRIPQPFADQVFYYAQADTLAQLSKGKSWRYTEIIPNDVIGFVPTGNSAMSLAHTLGLFLSFYASTESKHSGSGLKLAFPGSEGVYRAHISDVSQRTLARSHIFVSNLESTNGEAFNVADTISKKGSMWADRWPSICKYFGIEGVGPGEIEGQDWNADEYMRMHQDKWDAWEKTNELKQGIIAGAGWEFMNIIFRMAIFDRIYDQDKIEKAGFDQSYGDVEAYLEVFRLMEQARMLPSRSS